MTKYHIAERFVDKPPLTFTEAKQGSRTKGVVSLPMTRMEAEIFQAMISRGAKREVTVSKVYTIEG